MGNRQNSRFEMLINVTTKGGAELQKLGKAGEKAGKVFDALEEKMKAAGIATKEGQGQFTELRDDLKGVTSASDKYASKLRLLNKEQKKANPNPDRLAKYKRQVNEAMKSIEGYAKSINKLFPGLVKIDKRHRGGVKDLEAVSTAYVEAERRAKQYKHTVDKQDKSLDKSTVSTKKNTAEIKKNTAETKKNEFATNQLRQRLDTTGSSTFAKLRRNVGALRNQILLLTFATVALRSAFNASFAAANELEASLKGLGAVAINTGASFEGAKQAALDLNRQGLLSIQDAAAGLKNLLSAGFGLPEAIKLMNTLTDAASFNRQGTLSLGQAVVGATQGIKNQNSIMVDNAGITKNLSIMYKEYAESVGTSAGKLDEAGKRQAIFNGILKEGEVFAGNADAVINTMAGSLTVLGVQTQLAAAEMGKLTQPVASGFIKAFAESARATNEFAKALQENPKFMRRLIQVGFQLESLFSGLAKVAGTVGIAIGGLVSFFSTASIAGFNLAGALIKGTIAYKAYTTVVKGAGMSTQMAADIFQVAGGKTAILGQKVIFTDAAYKKYNGTIKQARIIHKLMNQEQLLPAIKLKEVLKGKTFALTASIKNFGTSLKLATGKLNIFRAVGSAAFTSVAVAARGLLSALGPIALAFLVFEGLTKAFSFLTGFSERASQVEKNAKRSTAALEAFQKQIQGLDRSMAATNKTADQYNDQLFNATALNEQFALVKQTQEKIKATRAEMTDDITLKEQAAIQLRLDNLQKEYDDRTAKLVEFQKKVEALNAQHEANIANGAARLAEQEKIITERANIADFLAATTKYQELLVQQRKFLATKEEAVDQSNKRLLDAEKAFGEASLLAAQEVEFQKAQLVQSNLDNMEKIQDSYQKKMVDMDATEIQRVEQKFKQLRDFERQRIEDQRQAALERLKIADQESFKVYEEASTGFAGTGVSASKAAAAGLPTELAKDIATFRQEDDKYTQVLSKFNMTADERNAILKGYRSELVKQKTALQDARSTSMDTNEISYINETVAGIDSQIDKIDKASSAYTVYNEGLEKTKNLTKDVNDTAAGATKTMEDQTSQQEFMQIAAIRYREDLRQLGLEYKRITNEVLKYGDAEKGTIGALDRNLILQGKLADVQSKYRNNTQSLGSAIKEFLNPLQNSDALLRKQTKAQEEFNLKQGEAMAKANDQVTIATRQAEAEKSKYDEMEKSNLYTPKELHAQDLRIKASEEKVKATEKEVEVLDKLQDVQAKVFSEDQTAERMQEQIARMTKYAEFFSGFIGKMQDLEHNRLMANQKYQKQINKEVMDGVLNQKQADALNLENMKVTAAEKSKQEKLALAGLIRDVGRQIMVYAAKKAAERGQIGQALGLLAAGVAANALINSYANKITREAESDYMDAQSRFERREAEIRGEGDNQSGSANQQRFGGSIKAQNLSVEINPTVVIQGEQVFIGQGSVNEFGAELQSLLLTSVNDAIENREIDLSNVSDRG